MDRDIERLTAVLQLQAEHPFDRVFAGEIIDPGSDPRDGALGKHVVQRALEKFGIRYAEIIGHIGRSHADRKIRQQRQKKAEWLDAARNMDRLAIAVGQIDALIHGHAIPQPARRMAARSNRLKVRRSAAIAFAGLPSVVACCSSKSRKLGQSCDPAPWLR